MGVFQELLLRLHSIDIILPHHILQKPAVLKLLYSDLSNIEKVSLPHRRRFITSFWFAVLMT